MATFRQSIPWRLGASALLAVVAMLVALLPIEESSAAWGWCLGDPIFTLSSVDADGRAVEAVVETDILFEANNLPQVTAGGYVTRITVPSNVNVSVDPASLVAYIDGIPMPGLMNIAVEWSHSNEVWDGVGKISIEIETILYASDPGFQVRSYYRYIDQGETTVDFRYGRSNKWMSKQIQVSAYPRAG
ncbi:MAG: hypothetical protein WEB00_14580 [Dehalococcoidia bacterium]